MTARRVVILAGGLLVGAFSCSAAAQTARGVVYDDANRNGRRDAGEAGLPGVRVSNGREIVKTDAEGRWELPAGDDTILFVIKPRDWSTPVDERNIPRFYYIHKPAGTPELKYPGVEPTGPLPESIDFPLTPGPEPERYQVLLIGDTQPYSMEEIEYLAHDIVEPLIGTQAAFAFSLGDLVGDHLDLHDPLQRVMAHIGVPIRNILGNHDMDYAAADDRHADDNFERHYGPSYYSFDYGPVHYIVLDSVVWYGKTEERDGYYRGGLGERQLAFIENDLQLLPKDQLVVLTMHIPMIEFEDKEELYALLARHPRTVSFSAHKHMHRHWFLDAEDGWPGPEPHHHATLVTACGSWWKGAPDEVGLPHTTMRDGAPNGWCILHLDGNDYRLEFRAARRPADYQMNIHAPEEVSPPAAADTDVTVNVFNGSERSTVELRFGDGPWRPMTRVADTDPYYVAIKRAERSDNPPRGRKLPKAQECMHLWRAKLPGDPPVGVHRIAVRTTDMHGQRYEAYRLIRVTK